MFLFKKKKSEKKNVNVGSSKTPRVPSRTTSLPTIHEKASSSSGRHLSVSVSSTTSRNFLHRKMESFLVPTYVLHDFEDGEECKVVRMIFEMSQVPYEFKHVHMDDYILEDYPYYALPMLEMNNKRFGSVLSICRHLAWRYNLSGKTAYEDAQIDDVAEKVYEVRIRIKNWIDHIEHAVDHECDEMCTKDDASLLLTTHLFPILERMFDNASTSWLVGHQISWLDLLVAHLVNPIIYHRPKLLEKFPKLYLHNKQLADLPSLVGFFYHVRPRAKFDNKSTKTGGYRYKLN